MTVLLNLASGTDLRPAPWVNLDVVPRWPTAARGCDVLWDARTQRIPWGAGTVDGVYAGYLLLHLSPRRHEPVLAEILRVLRPGAKATFGEVDMALVLPRWLADPESKNLSELVWGEQGDAHGADLADYDKHCWGFTEGKLRKTLERAGFVGLERVSVHHPDVWYELTIDAHKLV